ncbi:SDR family NAD(P)-dependent oxidoreductase [Candidatus Woesearchaeota archaeon]|nr:SDR family NAD(P)-dependent oxidoreductase [Candidatus Woesearchaeota archaeon]
MVILVTGGAGFIGSHVCDELLAKGKEVVCLDSLNDYYSPKAKINNILHNLKNDKFHFLTNNIREKHKLDHLFKKFNFEGIIHLAARAGVRASIEDPLAYKATNVLGTVNLLQSAKEFGVKNFVFASSSSVYGDSAQVPFSEDDQKVGRPISPYAASKASCELFAYNYSQMFDLNVTGLRFFTVYGPRNRPDMAVYKFAESIDQGKPIELYNNGELQRDFTYVKDIVDGTLSAYEKNNWNYEILNLGNSKPIKTKYLVELLEKNLGKKATITSPVKPKTDLDTTHADVSKAKRLLNWEPKTSIEEGIAKFVDWYKKSKTN